MAGRKKAEPILGAEASAIRKRYENDESIASIAADIRTSRDRVRAAIISAGGSIRDMGDWVTRRRKITPEQTAEIATKYLRGMSKREIAGEYDVSLATISHHLRKSGIGANNGG